MISVGTLGRVYIWVYLLNCKLFEHETWSTKNMGMGNTSRKNFTWLEVLGPNLMPFLIYQPTAIM